MFRSTAAGRSFLFCFFVLFIVSTPAPAVDYAGLLSGQAVVFPGGAYDSGDENLSPQFQEDLVALGEFLKNNKSLVIEIGGHTDNMGSRVFNEKLSFERARRVSDFLINTVGIPAERIAVKGYSSDKPVADNSTRDGRRANRRIEIIPIKNLDPSGTVSYIHRDVLSKSPADDDFLKARMNQSLFYKDRVLTRKKSHAQVMFKDQSSVNLDPESLMIMYATDPGALQKTETATVKLLNGGLRTKLNKLKGSFKLDTPSCEVTADSVEILVGVDDNKGSSVSVFDGSSVVAAQGSEVEVPKGYGTKVEPDKPPAPPEPLPLAPQLLNPMAAEFMMSPDQTEIDVQLEWIATEAYYHVQVARDSEFSRIIEDQTLAGNTLGFSSTLGIFYWRVSAINKSGLEGFVSISHWTVLEFKELPLTVTPQPGSTVMTHNRALTISGKTVADTVISWNSKKVQADSQGEFSLPISLKRGRNVINLTAMHAGYDTKSVKLTVLFKDFWESGTYVNVRLPTISDGDEFQSAGGFQLAVNAPFLPLAELEFGFGITRLLWDEDPGPYNRGVIAFPMTMEAHFLFGKGFSVPYISVGATGYFAFPREQKEHRSVSEFWVSPEIGIGYAFPADSLPLKLELKYSLFSAEEPFSEDPTNNIYVVLKCKL